MFLGQSLHIGLKKAKVAAQVKKKGVDYKPNSVPQIEAMVIYLGRQLPDASCNLPGNIERATLKRFPI